MVTYTHPDEEGWQTQVGPHVDWLVGEVDTGRPRASGPFVGTPVRSAMLIIDVANRAALDELIASEPPSDNERPIYRRAGFRPL